MWMKDTYIPLDVIFLDNKSYIVDIITNMKPHKTKSYKSKEKAKFALEINKGSVKKMGIKIGDKIGTKILKKNITDF